MNVPIEHNTTIFSIYWITVLQFVASQSCPRVQVNPSSSLTATLQSSPKYVLSEADPPRSHKSAECARRFNSEKNQRGTRLADNQEWQSFYFIDEGPDESPRKAHPGARPRPIKLLQRSACCCQGTEKGAECGEFVGKSEYSSIVWRLPREWTNVPRLCVCTVRSTGESRGTCQNVGCNASKALLHRLY